MIRRSPAGRCSTSMPDTCGAPSICSRKQGSHGPWTVEMSYAADRERLRKGPVEDAALHFSASPRCRPADRSAA